MSRTDFSNQRSASQGTKGMRTMDGVRLMINTIVPKPPRFCAPVKAVVGAPTFPMESFQKKRVLSTFILTEGKWNR